MYTQWHVYLTLCPILHRQTALIRDWRDILTEVGDHQSLIASLKQAPYHHLFKVHTPPQKLLDELDSIMQEGCRVVRNPDPHQCLQLHMT